MSQIYFSIGLNEEGRLEVADTLCDLPPLEDEFNQLVWLQSRLLWLLSNLEEDIEGHPDWIPEDEREY